MLASELAPTIRSTLNDDDGMRYTDTNLIEGMNAGVQEARRLRGDLFVGAYHQSLIIVGMGDEIPMPESYLYELAAFAAGWCELRDDEHVTSQRAQSLMMRYRKTLNPAAPE